MALSYPLTWPTELGLASIVLRSSNVVGKAASKFTRQSQTYGWARAQQFSADISLPAKMTRANAEAWVAFLLSLYGAEGSFLMPADTVNTSPSGSWAGSPKIKGAHAAGARTLAMDGFTPSAPNVAKRGDWLQVGSGSSSRLHKVLKDTNADGSGEASVEVWPSVRSALADDAAIVTSSPKGLFMLAGDFEYSIEECIAYGLQFSAVEDLRDL